MMRAVIRVLEVPEDAGVIDVICETMNGKLITKRLAMSLYQFEVAARCYRNGAKIQEAFPNLTPSEREFLMTGMTDEDWNHTFPPEKDPELDRLNQDQGKRSSNWLEDSNCLLAIADELDRAELIHPEWPDDCIYQAAIVNEEAGELIKACLEFRFEPNKGVELIDVVKEAVQVGAMAVRFLKNIPGIGDLLNEIKTEREEGHV